MFVKALQGGETKKGFPHDVINVIGKKIKVLTDCPEQEERGPIPISQSMHDYLRMMNETLLGRMIYVMTVGE